MYVCVMVVVVVVVVVVGGRRGVFCGRDGEEEGMEYRLFVDGTPKVVEWKGVSEESGR